MTTNSKAKEVLEIADSDLDGENLVTAKLCRKNGKTVLYVQADEKITDMIQQGSTRESGSWGTEFSDGSGGYEFYPDNSYNAALKAITNEYYDSYGSSTYVNRNKGNIAFLRTKDIEEGKYFDLTEVPLTEQNLKKIVRDIKEFVNEIREKFLKDVAVIGEIREVEIDKTVQTAFENND